MKNIMLKVVKFSYFFGAFFMLMSGYAQAYIDPSAVTYVIQAVAGVIIAIGALITVFRHKIVAFLKKGSKNIEKKEIHLKEDTK